MKCSNPDCNRCIGLVHYRRWFSKRRYCSGQCRDDAVTRLPRALQEERNATVCRQDISDDWLGNLRECLAHLV